MGEIPLRQYSCKKLVKVKEAVMVRKRGGVGVGWGGGRRSAAKTTTTTNDKQKKKQQKAQVS